MARDLGGTVESNDISEYGKADAELGESALFHDLPPEQVVWMSHRDSVTAPPPGARVTASSPSTPIAAFEDEARGLYAVQFHPEVVHTPDGQQILKNFLYEVAGAPPSWTPAAVIEEQVERIRARSARSGSSAGCPAASTRRSPRCSSTRPSATSSHACSSTTG